MQASTAGDIEIERRLADYARARLTPSDGAKARARARVMGEARLSFKSRAAEAAATAAGDLHQRHTASRRTALRRGAGLLLAAALSVGVVGGALAASGPGGPLYGPRVWLETVTLPTDASARADAEIRRLEERMTEIEAAVRSGDRAAVAAALAAYSEIADEALLDASGDEAAIERLRAALDRHVAVLQEVAGQVPWQATDAITRNIERAIEHNDATIHRIESNPGRPSTTNGAAPATKPEKSAKPEPTPQAAATPKPAVKPAATPGGPPPAEPTPKPGKTPPGQVDRPRP